MKVIASIEEPEVIKNILNNRSPPTRADGLFEPATILI
jgi:hypothetical protein